MTPAATENFDAVILGGGIAGATVAAHLAPYLRVAIVEREPMLAYHTTGRSAAMFVPSYGVPDVRALTAASAAFFRADAAPGEASLFRPRPVLHVARADQLSQLDALTRSAPDIQTIGADEALRRVPILRPEAVAAGAIEEHSGDIDVAALHERYVRTARAAGAAVLAGWGETVVEPIRNGWRIRGRDASLTGSVIVNATGAWADQTATAAGVRALGLQPLLRSVALLDPPQDPSFPAWPTVMDVGEQYYFRPFGKQLLLTACDEIPSAPCDAAADPLSVAQAIDRFAQATSHPLSGPLRKRWGGLRTFAPDRRPRIGWAEDCSSFFWVAGLGGFGVQTSPAVGKIAASAILRRFSNGHGLGAAQKVMLGAAARRLRIPSYPGPSTPRQIEHPSDDRR